MYTSPPASYMEGLMSWKATYFVKTLTHHPNGKPLTARQKLVLFVLADYHHDERGCAWVSVRKAAQEALTSPTWLVIILKTLEKHGTLTIERREGKSHLYRFPGLCKPLEQSPCKPLAQPQVLDLHTTVQARVAHTVQVQSGTEPLEPSGTVIQAETSFRPADYFDLALQERRRTGKTVDEILGWWREHPEERPLC